MSIWDHVPIGKTGEHVVTAQRVTAECASSKLRATTSTGEGRFKKINARTLGGAVVVKPVLDQRAAFPGMYTSVKPATPAEIVKEPSVRVGSGGVGVYWKRLVPCAGKSPGTV